MLSYLSAVPPTEAFYVRFPDLISGPLQRRGREIVSAKVKSRARVTGLISYPLPYSKVTRRGLPHKNMCPMSEGLLFSFTTLFVRRGAIFPHQRGREFIRGGPALRTSQYMPYHRTNIRKTPRKS